MNKLIISDSFNNSDMFYAAKVLIPDPFIFLSLNSNKYILVNSLEFERVKKQAPKGVSVILQDIYVKKAKSKFKSPTLANIAYFFLKEKKVSLITVPPKFPIIYADSLRKLKIKVKIENPFYDRSIKTNEEIKKIKEVQSIVDKAFIHVVNLIKKSKIKNNYLYLDNIKLSSEFLKNEIQNILYINNIESPEGVILSSGKTTAYPHDMGSGPIIAGVPIIIDIFPRSQKTRYFSDFTRTVCKGNPLNQKIQQIYDMVKEAQKAGYAQIKEGVSGNKVHNAVLSIFKKHKMEKYFIHSTGHGVGLDIHETPGIPSKTKLKAGMIITNEPGLYISGLGGVRIEDPVLVTKSGYLCLTNIPKYFII